MPTETPISPEGRNSLSDINMPNFQASSRNTSGNSAELLAPVHHSSANSHESQGIGHRPDPNDSDDAEGANALERPNVPDPRRPKHYRRPLPQPRPFEGKGDIGITQFFRVYERYAQSMWGDTRSDWVDGLESLLLGWALILYRGLVEQRKQYPQIKAALMAAFPGVVDPFQTRNLMKLLNIKREPGEPLPVFFMRIENLVGQTYPDLEEASKQKQVRDTFLMKCSQNTAMKIANYCNIRGDFTPEVVREAATMIGLGSLDPQGASAQDIDETVYLSQPTGTGGVNPQTSGLNQRITPTNNIQTSAADIKCYICAASWHPVSACPLYPVVFSCPLCRADPHPITSCQLYNDWLRAREGISRAGAGWSNETHQNRRWEAERDRDAYQRNYRWRSTRETTQRSAYPYTESYSEGPDTYRQPYRYEPESSRRSSSEDRSRRQDRGSRDYERSLSSARYPSSRNYNTQSRFQKN